MSAKKIISALVVGFVFGWTSISYAEDKGKSLEVAKLPTGGVITSRDVGLLHARSADSHVIPDAEGSASGFPSLSENSWDFTNPNSVPGFGALPPSYDSRSVLPRFSGQ